MKKIIKKTSKQLNHVNLGIFLVVFAAVGSYLILRTLAAAPTSSFEAEQGTVNSPAVKQSDVTASGGQYVQFINASSPSGQAMPVGDLPGWKQVFTDDFTNNASVGSFLSAYGTKWGAYNAGESSTYHDTSGHGTYSPAKTLSVNSGILNMNLHTENGVHYVSAPYPKVKGQSAATANGQLYGRYVVRFRADSLHGYKTAFLLWPDSGGCTPNGEIDFPEGNLDSTFSGFMHRFNNTVCSDQDSRSTNTTYANWHTATIEWASTGLTFYLDGSPVGTTITSRVPSLSMHWVLQAETALDGTIPADTTAGNVQVDWVAVYTPQ